MKLLSRSATLTACALLLLIVALFSASVAFAQPPAQDVEVTDEPVFPTNTITATPTEVVIEATEEVTEVAAPLPEPTPADPTDEDPAPAPSPLPDVDPDAAGSLLITTILAIVGAVASSPVTTTIVSLLKQIPALNRISSKTLAFTVACVLWVVIALSDALGFRIQLDSLATFIQTGLPTLVGFVVTLFGGSWVYNAAATQNVPLLGYQRPMYTEARANVASTVSVSQQFTLKDEALPDRIETLEELVQRLATTPQLDTDELARSIGKQLTPEIERIVDARIATALANTVAGG